VQQLKKALHYLDRHSSRTAEISTLKKIRLKFAAVVWRNMHSSVFI